MSFQRRLRRRTVRASLTRACLALAICLAIAGGATACPFCTQVSKTLGETFATMDTVVVARLVEPPPPAGKEADGKEAADSSTFRKAKFEIVEIIKGQEHLRDTKRIESYFFGEFKVNSQFLLLGTLLPNLEWSTPIALDEHSRKYIGEIASLPEKGPRRLAYFMEYLDDKDPLLARDAYDEFARAPYLELIGIKDRMDRGKILAHIQHDDTTPSLRRLYLTMLGICGTKEDIATLEAMMRSGDRRQKQALDAMIACYLTLRGADGLPLIEELFLTKKNSEYADMYAAVMALRFHGEEENVIPRPRLSQSLAILLERPNLADLVVSDFSRWEDWSVMERLIKLFKDSDAKVTWVRAPVVSYLMVASEQEGPVGQRAKQAIEELTAIDPQAVKQAQAYGIFGNLMQKEKERPAAADTTKPAASPADQKSEDPAPSLEDKGVAPARPSSSESPPKSSTDVAPAKTPPVAASPNNASPSEPTKSAPLGVGLVVGLAVLAAALFGAGPSP